MNKQVDVDEPNDVIRLADIWKKLVQYKKVFWSVFFAAFITGGAKILLVPVPLQYTFSQVIEIGKSPDEKGQNTINMSLDDAIKKIKKVFYPAAVRAYNLHAIEKTVVNEKMLTAENVGNGTLLLSMDGSLKDFDRCKFILQKIVDGFSSETREYIDYRRKTLSNTKLNLEHRLTEMNNFYKAMTVKYFDGVSKNRDMVSVESKIITMYLNDQNSLMIQLSNDINILQAQIIGTYNTRAASDLIVSERPGQPKFILLVLLSIGAFFFAFAAVYVFEFMILLKNKLS